MIQASLKKTQQNLWSSKWQVIKLKTTIYKQDAVVVWGKSKIMNKNWNK